MKVRIGVGISGSQLTHPQMVRLVDDLEDLGFDSLWLSEVLTTSVIDPLVGMAWVAGRKSKLKLGTTMLLPGRNPVRLAKEFIQQGHVEYDLPFNMREAIAFFDRGNIKKLAVWRKVTKDRKTTYTRKRLVGNRYLPCKIYAP